METEQSAWKLHVHYCGGWVEKVKAIISAVQKKWPGTQWEGQVCDSFIGVLEVTVIKKDGSKKLVHSKLNGDGDVEEQNIASLIAKIEAYIK